MASSEAPATTMPPRSTSPSKTRLSGNLDIRTLPTLDWRPEYLAGSLESLFRWVEGNATDAYSWYVKEKDTKSPTSKTLRILAVVLLTTGGIIPLLSSITNRTIDGEWGFVALALGAGTLLLDRAFGFSASWVRYQSTAMELKSEMTRAQLSWVRRQAELSELMLVDAETLNAALSEITQFASAVSDLVRHETEQWALDFRENLTELRGVIGSSPR